MPKFEAPAKTWDGPLQFLSGNAPTRPASHVVKGSLETATVKFAVQVDGTVGPIEIVESTSPLLGEWVVEAVKQWRFKPATKGGVPQVIWAQQTFSMDL